MPSKGNTFKPLVIDTAKLNATTTISDFLTELTAKVERFSDDNSSYYDTRRERWTRWATFSRVALAVLTVFAFGLTTAATIG
jgi:hypothetical protein